MRYRRQNGVERGYALFALMMTIAIVTVWMANAALAAGYGALAAASTRDRMNVRIAANDRATGAVAGGTGGSVWPAPPADGFADFLVMNERTGRLDVVAEGDLPRDGDVVLRQWRLSANPGGGRRLEVSAVLVDAATRAAVAPPRGVVLHRTRIVE